jgi:hypothetical protein
MLTAVGFVDLRRTPADISTVSYFADVHGHGKVIGEAVNRFEAFAIEAVKPGGTDVVATLRG